MEDQEYVVLGNKSLHVLIPKDSPLEMKLMVLAALKAYAMRLKSIDGVLKRYRDSWEEQLQSFTDSNE